MIFDNQVFQVYLEFELNQLHDYMDNNHQLFFYLLIFLLKFLKN